MRCFDVAANRIDLCAKRCTRHEHPHRHDTEQSNNHRDRNAPKATKPKHIRKRKRQTRDRHATRKQQRSTTSKRRRPECHDEGRDIEIGDTDAIQQPHTGRRGKTRQSTKQDHQKDRIRKYASEPDHNRCTHNRRKRNRRPHREIKPTGDQHQHLSERHQHQIDRLAHDIDEVLSRQKLGRQQGENHQRPKQKER